MACANKLKSVAVTFLVLIFASSVYAYEDEENTSDSSPAGHWYVGSSTGYLKPDGNRLGGNTRTLGFQGGYQFNDKWSMEMGYQQDAFGPGKDDAVLYDLEFVRHWGDKFRFLIEFGYTHISLDASSGDDATAGFHVGAGLSAFITDNFELRGDAKLPYSQNDKRLDSVGTLSLNYHFVGARTQSEVENQPVLGSSNESSQSLPPMEYREPTSIEEPEEKAVTIAPSEPVVAEEVVAAPATVATLPPEQAVVAPTSSLEEVVQPAANNTSGDFIAPNAVPKSTHALLNFGANGVDPIGGQYSEQLDQVSQEIKASNAKAVIEGHTDGNGSSEGNKILSLDRAIVVKQELKKRGVDGSKLRAVGYGEEHPVATNDTKEGRAQNRRVEVKIYDNQQ